MNHAIAHPGRRRLLHLLTLATLGAGVSRAHAFGAHCGLTQATTAGPFYVRNAPRLADINRHRAPGTPMHVTGTVFGGRDGRQPLAGAIVEIWHCDADGRYHPSGSGDITRYTDDEVNLRGIVLTDEAGRYAFDSIVPGHYGTRRRHIHWHVVAAGHRPLTTQSYWADERGTARERRDPVDRNTDDCRWVAFASDAHGVATGRFDVVLAAIG